jgi:acetylornithine deacetylase
VPAECEFVFSVRVTETSVARRVETELKEYIDSEILPAMRKEYPAASVNVVRVWSVPAFNSPERAPFIRTVRSILKNHKVQKLAGGTEGGFFQDLGMPTIIVGPGGYRGHMANEYTEVAFLKKSEVFTTDIVRRMTTGVGIVEEDAKL